MTSAKLDLRKIEQNYRTLIFGLAPTIAIILIMTVTWLRVKLRTRNEPALIKSGPRNLLNLWESFFIVLCLACFLAVYYILRSSGQDKLANAYLAIQTFMANAISLRIITRHKAIKNKVARRVREAFDACVEKCSGIFRCRANQVSPGP